MCAPVRLFLTSQALAALAGSMMLLALGVWAKQLTDSSTLAGLCTAAATTPRLLGIFLGESLDRLPRRTALLGADLGTVAALALLWVVQHDEQYWPLPVFGVVYGTLGVLAHTASPGALKAITTPEETPRAVSVLQVVNGTVLIVGPVTGTAVLGAWGPRWLIGVTSLLLLVGALLLVLVDIPRHDGAGVPGRWAGLQLLWADGQLRIALVTLILAYGVIGLVDGSLYADRRVETPTRVRRSGPGRPGERDDPRLAAGPRGHQTPRSSALPPHGVAHRRGDGGGHHARHEGRRGDPVLRRRSRGVPRSDADLSWRPRAGTG